MDRRKFIGGIAGNSARDTSRRRSRSSHKLARRRCRCGPKAGALLSPNTARNLGSYASTEPGGKNITDFSGITYDPIGKRMCLFGGGHGPSQETDIRILDLATTQWSSPLPDHAAQRR